MTRPQARFVLSFVACIALAGCTASTETVEGEGQGAEVVAPSTDSGATSQGLTQGSGFMGDPLDDPDNILYSKIVYFDFDRSDIRPEDRPIIEAHAEYLSQHPNARVTLEGHADERGTREYNIALGERRANSVRNLIALRGAAGQQLDTVSYGEERPADPGHGEASWALNRRVEIVYISR